MDGIDVRGGRSWRVTQEELAVGWVRVWFGYDLGGMPRPGLTGGGCDGLRAVSSAFAVAREVIVARFPGFLADRESAANYGAV